MSLFFQKAGEFHRDKEQTFRYETLKLILAVKHFSPLSFLKHKSKAVVYHVSNNITILIMITPKFMHDIYFGIITVLGHYSYLHQLSKCNKYEDDFNNGISINY